MPRRAPHPDAPLRCARAAASAVAGGVLVVLLLAGCAGSQTADGAAAPSGPDSAAHGGARRGAGSPAAEPVHAERLLREALAALEQGDQQGALALYRRLLADDVPPPAQARALVCIAVLQLTPGSALKDPQAAARTLRELEQRVSTNDLAWEFSADLELLRLLQAREGDLRTLRESNRRLAAELAAKQELIRQLRALSVERE